MTLTESQLRVISILPMFTGTLSLFGSATVIYIISRSHAGLKTTYHRLVFGMASTDILQSLCQAFSTLPVPKGTIGIMYAMGTDTTCNIQGFIQVFSCISTLTYLCGLTGYFLLAIKFEVSDEMIEKWYEPIIHFYTIGFSLANSIFVAIHSGFFTMGG